MKHPKYGDYFLIQMGRHKGFIGIYDDEADAKRILLIWCENIINGRQLDTIIVREDYGRFLSLRERNAMQVTEILRDEIIMYKELNPIKVGKKNKNV